MKFLAILVVLENYMMPCLTKKYFGVDCPGCGLQRSIAFLIRGDFASAWDMYPAIFTIIPLTVILVADQFFKIRNSNKIIITLVITTVGLIVTNYILKFF